MEESKEGGAVEAPKFDAYSMAAEKNPWGTFN